MMINEQECSFEQYMKGKTIIGIELTGEKQMKIFLSDHRAAEIKWDGNAIQYRILE